MALNFVHLLFFSSYLITTTVGGPTRRHSAVQFSVGNEYEYIFGGHTNLQSASTIRGNAKVSY